MEIKLLASDSGLENIQRAYLEARGAIIAQPEGDFKILSSFNTPSQFKASLARPSPMHKE